jgi:hypothetical protein
MNENFIKEIYKKYELAGIASNSSIDSALHMFNRLIANSSIKFDVIIDKEIEKVNFIDVKEENNKIKIAYKQPTAQHKIKSLFILIKKDIDIDLSIDKSVNILIFSLGLKNLNVILKNGTLNLTFFEFYGSLNIALDVLEHSKLSFNFIPALNTDSKFKIIGNIKEDSHLHINEIAVLNNTQKLDLETLAFLEGAQSVASINSRALLYDHSLCILKGYAESKENAKNSNSLISQGSILLSKYAHVDSIPVMVIKTNDVKASHESYVVPINNELLFFASTRGIEETKFKKLLTHAFVETLIEKINDEKAREITLNIINNKVEEGAKYDV